MTWEEAQERFAAQISEAQASATQRGAQEERARLEEIDALGLADADMVREAKYGDKPMTAEQIAVKALKAAAGKPAAVLSARMAEAEVTTDAGAGAVPGTESAKAAAQSENASKLREAYMSVAGLKK